MSTIIEDQVRLIEGGLAVDDRGEVRFCNALDLTPIRRFYMVSNHAPGFVRAWHAHKRECKFAFVLSGAAIVSAVKIDDWSRPSRELKVHRFVLSEKKPAVLSIPAGHANGFKTLTADAKILFLSTATLEESAKDDIRFEAFYWNPWDVEAR